MTSPKKRRGRDAKKEEEQREAAQSKDEEAKQPLCYHGSTNEAF